MKRKLFLLLCALLTMVGVQQVRAQASYNHTYTEGVTVAAGENYFLYNIASGMFLTDGMDYGTHASIDHAGRVITLATSGGGYTINTTPYSANGSELKNGGLFLDGSNEPYVDGTSAEWTFEPVSVDGYTNAYAIKSGGKYLYTEYKDNLYQGKMGAYVRAGNSTNDASSYWLLIPKSTRESAGDCTYMLRNGDFNHPWEFPIWTNAAGWTNIAGGKKENVCAEMYGKGFDISQTISAKVANGKYILYNQAFYNNADASNQTYLYANDNQSAIAILNANGEGTASNMAGASTAFTAGQYVNSVTAIVTDGSLKVGIKNATAAGNARTIMDNFYLEYYGNKVSVYAPTLFTNNTSATGGTWYSYPVSTEGYKISSSAATTLYYTQNENDDADVTRRVNISAGGYTYLNLSEGTLYFKSSKTSTINIESAASVLKDGDVVTGFIKDAAVTGTADWTNGRTGSNQQYAGAPDNTYMDTWNDTRDQNQTIILPSGYYLLKAATRAHANVSVGYIYANEGNTNLGRADIHKEGASGNLLGNGWGWTYVPFYVDATKEVTIGFKSECGSNKWAGADNFTLVYYTTAASRDAAHLADVKSEANAWLTQWGETVPNAVRATIQNAIEDEDATVSSVQTAIATARSYATNDMVNNYALFKKWKPGVEAILEVAVTDNEKKESIKGALEDVITTTTTNVDNATTAAAVETENTRLKTAALNYIKKLTPADVDNASFDLTFLITNPSFSNNSMEGWSGTTPNFGNDATQKAAKACEYYQKEFNIYQQLTDMVTGNYRLKVKAFQRPGAASAVVGAYVGAGDKKDGTFGTTSEIYVNGGNEAAQAIKNVTSPLLTTKVGSGEESEVTVSDTKYYIPNDMVSAVAYFSEGHYENVANITASTSTITFGFRSTQNHVNYDWTIFDDFRLYYTGQLDLDAFKQQLAAKVAEANGIKSTLTGKIPTAALTALQNSINSNDNDDDTFNEEEQFTEAIDNINTAISDAQALQEPYASYIQKRGAIQALYDVEDYEEITAGAHDALGAAIDAANTAVNAATTVEGINNATDTQIPILKDAGKTYVGRANPTGSAKFDCTFMLTNPDLTPFYTGNHNVKPAGWTSEETDGNYQVIPSEDAANPDGTHKYCYEYWSNPAKASEKFALYNAVTLPQGTFFMSCYAFAKDQFTDKTVDGVYFYANDTQGSCVTDDVLTKQTLSFVNSTEQEVKIGLKTVTGNTRNWMGIGYVELYKVPTQTYTVDENQTWDKSQSGAGDVTLNRTIKVGVNTLVLPFSMTQEEVESKFGTGSKVYAVSSYNAETENISFAVREGISANQPCLLKATVAGTSYTLDGRTIVAGDPTIEGTNVTMIGGYNALNEVSENDNNYIVSGDKLYFVDSDGVSMKGTRAYIHIAGNSGARLTIAFDDEDPTAINSIEAAEAENSVKDGKYLENGKIVIVKNGVKYSANGQILK